VGNDGREYNSFTVVDESIVSIEVIGELDSIVLKSFEYPGLTYKVDVNDKSNFSVNIE
jgi:hypothetical protein